MVSLASEIFCSFSLPRSLDPCGWDTWEASVIQYLQRPVDLGWALPVWLAPGSQYSQLPRGLAETRPV